MDIRKIYTDFELYEREYRYLQEDLKFWKKCTQEYHGDWLELGCGSGRVGKEIYDSVNSYTGIDISTNLLDGFKKMYPQVFESENNKILSMDIRNFDLETQYDAIIIPLNTISHLYSTTDFSNMCKCVVNHLKKDGVFIIDYFNPNLRNLKNNKEFSLVSDFVLKDSTKVYLKENSNYSESKQINYITRAYSFSSNIPDKVVTIPMRVYFPLELDYLLISNGFKIINKYGNYNKDRFHDSSTKQIIILSKS